VARHLFTRRARSSAAAVPPGHTEVKCCGPFLRVTLVSFLGKVELSSHASGVGGWWSSLPGAARKLAHAWLTSDHASGVCFQPDSSGRKLARRASFAHTWISQVLNSARRRPVRTIRRCATGPAKEAMPII
jgi:hypothetical protein